jgi:hypothetical protein
VFPPFGGETQEIVGVAPDLLGARPSLDSSAKTPFRPDVACETNAPPDLESGAAAPPPALTPASTAAPDQSPALRDELRELAARFERLGGHRGGPDAAEDAVTDLNELLARAYGWEALMEVGGP